MAKTVLRNTTRKRLGRSGNSTEVPPKVESKVMNRSLSAAKAAKQDEFYTQYVDIQKEVEAYLEYDADTFRNKVLYCNCDDPFESNFFKYFAANFNKLGLEKLITTSYDGSPIAGQMTLFPEYNEGNGNRQKPKALAVILDRVKDEDGNGAANITDVEKFLKRNKAARIALKGDPAKYPGGDFRSSECVAFLKQADIVVTNPPFSLLREYVTQLVEHGKKFLIIANKNAITYQEFFPLIKRNGLWLGVTPMGTDLLFDVPPKVAKAMLEFGKEGSNYKIVEGKVLGRSASVWFTNLDHGRRHKELPLMTTADNLKYSKHEGIKGREAYVRFDNFDAIEVPYTDAIPSDHDGMIGVPISFLDKYNPDQFKIVGYEYSSELHTKEYPIQLQVDKNGKKSKVTKLNDAAAIKVAKPPSGKTYYIVDGEYFVAAYKRIFIRHRRPAEGKKK
ncbi:MAG: hypothetical protein JSR62_17690 [Nitrospira sp.]|nr:hypothetical protein [Nitrospira sp.]